MTGQYLIERYFGESAKCDLHSVFDSVDTSHAGGRLVLNVLLSVAQWEREATSERIAHALQHKISNGQRVGSVRFGFDLCSDGVTLERNESEQRVIRDIYEMRKRGMSYRAIANELDRRGVPTKKRRGKWPSSSIVRILERAPA